MIREVINHQRHSTFYWFLFLFFVLISNNTFRLNNAALINYFDMSCCHYFGILLKVDIINFFYKFRPDHNNQILCNHKIFQRTFVWQIPKYPSPGCVIAGMVLHKMRWIWLVKIQEPLITLRDFSFILTLLLIFF